MAPSFWILVALVFVFTYVNGFHDGCNVVATLIASRAMKPHPALAWAAVVELLSPFAILVVGSSVSDTIKKLVGEVFYTDPGMRSTALAFITAGILAAILWNVTTWRFGIPASSSHALIGGVVGAGLAAFGSGAISWNYFWGKVVLMIFLTPAISFVVGFLILKFLRLLTRNASVGINKFFTYAQWLNMTFLAFNHSFNDSQKSIGIVMILLGIYGGSVDAIPVWAIACAALCLSCGIAFGGFKIIKTVGTGIYKVQPIHSFSSQLTAGAVILSASLRLLLHHGRRFRRTVQSRPLECGGQDSDLLVHHHPHRVYAGCHSLLRICYDFLTKRCVTRCSNGKKVSISMPF